MRKTEFFCKNKGFRGDDHRRREHHVIAQLHPLPRARRATVNDIAPHLLQDGLGPGEMFRRAADHKG